jgi:hypothetical protein
MSYLLHVFQLFDITLRLLGFAHAVFCDKMKNHPAHLIFTI